jgi:hypothetical protein
MDFYNSFDEMAAGTGALVPQRQSVMGAFVDNTDSQDDTIERLRGIVEIYPEQAIKDINHALEVWEYMSRNGHVPQKYNDDFCKYKANLEACKQKANAVIVKKAKNCSGRQPLDLTKEQFWSGYTSEQHGNTASDETPIVS